MTLVQHTPSLQGFNGAPAIDEGKADPTIQNKDGKTARAVAEEELREMENALVMGEDDNGDEDRPNLKELVDYLKSFEEDGRKSCSDGR